MDSVARVQEKEKKSLFQGSNRLKLIKANFSVLKKSITATLEHKVQQARGGACTCNICERVFTSHYIREAQILKASIIKHKCVFKFVFSSYSFRDKIKLLGLFVFA